MQGDSKNMRKKISINIPITIMILVLFGAMWGTKELKLHKVEAAVLKNETIDLRIIGTTDLHGQLNSKDYEKGVDYNNGGLARVFDLIQNIRGDLPKENSFTLDAGDVLYDYTTEYIFSESRLVLQPIYKAMREIGYDAITLGNHDFDYGYEYIQSQLNLAGLRDITVVSNVTDSKTGEYPFVENMLITRMMETASGKKVEVTVGIIGQTIPTLTSKTQNYTGVLKTEDMVLNAQIQATKLKEMGADIIIALSHTGIGPESPELNFKNVAYALTKIPEVDVVVSGHEHNLFPTTDMTSPYFNLPGVDKKSYLMNGKNVIMAGDRGEAVGVVELTLEVSEDGVEIVNRKSEIRQVTAKNTTEDKSIAVSYGVWEEKLLDYSTDIIGKLNEGELIQNYYGLLGDNTAIQILNDAKINYASRYVNTTGNEYINYPIISASTYTSFGAESIDNFINIHDSITEANLSEIQRYNDYLYVYTITGKQLKEWLEWTASAYETLSMDSSKASETMSSLMEETGLKPLIREEWQNDWSSFYIFDGIDYAINPRVEPRYDISGNRVNSTRRIQNVKYNGTVVEDNTILLLATNKITQPVDANRGVDKQVALNGFTRSQTVLGKYVKQLSSGESILPQVDNNWSVILPQNYKFLTKVPYYARELFENTKWDLNYLKEVNQYCYYIASVPKESSDITSPHIIATPIITNPTASPYEIAVHVSDASEIKLLRYMPGEFDIDFIGWPSAYNITNQVFTVRKNGTYSICAEDIHGNKTVMQLVINNFSDNLLGRPTVVTYTNRKSSISGTAEPGATIVFEANSGIYESKIGTNGKFSYLLPSQPSGTMVNVYVKDEKRGLESERVAVLVKRTGPNIPSLNPIYNNSGYIVGKTNDKDATIIAIIGGKVYVSAQGGKELYEKNTEVYNKSLDIIETNFEAYESGFFIMLLPSLEAGETVTIYNIDHLSRNSRSATTKVIEAAPNAPVVYEVSNIEKSLNGYVPSKSNKIYNITLTLGDKTYKTKSDENGNFNFQFDEQLKAGQILTITSSDIKNGVARISYAMEVKVNDIESYVRVNSTNLTLNRVTSKSNLVSGSYLDNGSVNIAIASGEGDTFENIILEVEKYSQSKYQYLLEEKLEVGTKIYVMTRFTDGKILLANKTVVLPGRPDTPSLLSEVTNADKLVKVIANKDCEITLTIGSKVYHSSIYEYDELMKQYSYTFVTDRDISGTIITISSTNVTGTGDIFTSRVVKAAPDSPQVNTVKAGDKVITGKIDLLDDQTKVYAQIGKKKYEGAIDEEGNMKITIPKQSSDIAIKIWGTNKAGRGPLVKVLVVS